jgi:hypothetical protein
MPAPIRRSGGGAAGGGVPPTRVSLRETTVASSLAGQGGSVGVCRVKIGFRSA